VLPRVATLRGSARSIRCGGKCNFLYGGVWPFGASAAALAGSHDGACREREREVCIASVGCSTRTPRQAVIVVRVALGWLAFVSEWSSCSCLNNLAGTVAAGLTELTWRLATMEAERQARLGTAVDRSRCRCLNCESVTARNCCDTCLCDVCF
jgi:hypothetical protein